MPNRNLIAAALTTVAATVSIGLHPARAAVYQGTLATDDAVVLFSIPEPSGFNLAIYTTSYGGGTNLDGTTTNAGGFLPVITLFSPTGQFVATDGGNPFPAGAVDPSTGVPGDALINAVGLSAGIYTLAVSEYFNLPVGDLPDGFAQTGSGNFTEAVCGFSSGGFYQVNLSPCPERSSAFTVDVAVPEPATVGVLGIAFAMLVLARGSRRLS